MAIEPARSTDQASAFTPAEANRLAELEAIVDRGLDAFVEVARLPTSRNPRNWFEASRSRHSAEPADFQLVERASPGPYVELFARGERRGWTTWGNEVPSVDGDP
jgi:hypothetical protein